MLVLPNIKKKVMAAEVRLLLALSASISSWADIFGSHINDIWKSTYVCSYTPVVI
jgi:hypothetical protein